MPSRLLLALLALAATGCAATTPPPRFSAVSPADPEAPEGALPPASAVLTTGPEATPSPAPSPATSPTPTPTPHHHGGGR